jgi:hypothetical protein
LFSHVGQIVLYLYALVVDWAVHVLAEDLHRCAALAVYALDPEIFVLGLQGLELEQLGHLDLQGFSLATVAEGFL